MRTKQFIMSALLLASLLCWPAVGGCSPSQTYQISETELQTLSSHLTALEQNNNELLTLLNASNLDLTEASRALNESQKELSTLKAQLTELQQETTRLSESLKIANQELANARISFRESEKERDRIENRLRNQRNVWEVIACIAIGVAVAH